MSTNNDNAPVRHYLSGCADAELRQLILYPSALYDDLYEWESYSNGDYTEILAEEILGEGYSDWTKYDSTSYDWWLNIKEGRYAEILGITADGYFSDDDAAQLKALQQRVRALRDELETPDIDDYYDKGGALEDEADRLADEALQIVVRLLKDAETVTDDQIVESFKANGLGDEYYYLGDDKSTIYRDTVMRYKTGLKGDNKTLKGDKRNG